jgi:hypothetical protein
MDTFFTASLQSADAQLAGGYGWSWRFTGRSNRATPKLSAGCSERQLPEIL